MDLTNKLAIATYANNGDVSQLLVLLTDPKPGYLVVRTDSSHGSASLPTVETGADLADLIARIHMELREVFTYREPSAEIAGTGQLAATATELQALVNALTALNTER